MTVLTWRDVAAPDFRGVTDSLELASKSFNGAFNGLQGTLGDIEKDKTQNQSTALLAEIANYQGRPDELKAAIPGMLAKYDARYLDKDTLSTVMNRPTALLEQASKESAYAQAQKSIADSDYFRDNREVFNGYLQAHRNLATNANAVKEFLANEQNSKIISGADSGLLTSFMGRAQDLTDSDLRTRGTQFSFANDVEAKAVGEAMEDLTRVLAEKMPDERMATLRQIGEGSKNFTPAQARAYNKMWAQYAGQYPGMGGGGTDVGAVGGGVPGDGARVMNYEARASGFTAVPDTVRTLGQASDFALQVNQANLARMGKPGSSAMGTFQITGDTLRDFAPRVFGAGWQNIEFNAANQDKIAKAIFEDAKAKGPAALQGRWTSLTNGKAQQVANMSWEDARVVIAQGESGVNLRDLQTAAGTIARDNNLTESARVAIKAQELANDRREPRAIANALTGKGGVFAGQDVDNLTQKIDDISRKYRISPAQAAYVMELSDNGKKNWFGRQFTWAPGNDGLTVDINDSEVEQYGRLFGDPKALASASVSVDHNAQAQQAIGQSRAQVEALTQQIKTRQAALEAAGIQGDDRTMIKLKQQLTAALEVEGQTAMAGAEVAANGATGRGVDRQPANRNPKPAPSQRRTTMPPVKPDGSGPIFAAAVQGKPREVAKPTAKDINALLARVRETGTAFNKVKDKPLAFRAGKRQAYEASVNRALSAAIRSGLPQFQRQPNETAAEHHTRVEKLLLAGRTR